MRNTLKHKTILFLIVVFSVGCGHVWHPVCRHRTMFAALTVCEHETVRIARGITPSGSFHVQPQALLEEGWVWLGVSPHGFIYESGKDNFTPFEYYSIPEYFDWKWGDK